VADWLSSFNWFCLGTIAFSNGTVATVVTSGSGGLVKHVIQTPHHITIEEEEVKCQYETSLDDTDTSWDVRSLGGMSLDKTFLRGTDNTFHYKVRGQKNLYDVSSGDIL
jgi:hypothetical protein